MKVVIVVLGVLGAGLAASINPGPKLPELRGMVVEPIGQPSDLVQSMSPSSRIINGNEVVPHSIPYQAFLISTGFLHSWTCGGSLITTKTVLTAAYCMYDADHIQVFLGSHNLTQTTEGELALNAASWKGHEEYNQNTMENDIAVIILESAVQLTPTIGIARLPSYGDVDNDYVGRDGRVSGWGATSEGGYLSRVLREVNNTVISNDECKLILEVVTDKQMCLSAAGRRTVCGEDTGGPMVIGDTQIGIISSRNIDCLADYPSIYVRIPKFLDWIEANSDWRSL